MMSELVLLERHDAVALITLNRPPLNIINLDLLNELRQAVATVASDESIRCVVVTGGAQVFAAGADVSEFAAATDSELRRFAPVIQEGLGALSHLPQPVIASISGYALGGGFELALACDLRIAADTAVFALPEILLGIIPGGGGTQRLPRLVGTSKALELAWTGARFGAHEALAIGAVNEVVPAAELQARTLALATLMASRPQLAVRAIKRAVVAGEGLPLAQALALETAEFATIFESSDAREGMAAFLEKREPRFDHS